MIKIRYWIKDFFGFPRTQVNGFLILLMLVTLFLFSEPAWHWWISNRPADLTADKAKLDSIVALWDREKTFANVQDTLLSKLTPPFYFDPNHSTMDEFVALGFSQQLATRIIRYREKGGKFRIKSDVLKIYGTDSAFYHRIYSFIKLPVVAQPIQKAVKKYLNKDVVSFKGPDKFDLNKADTSVLKEIYGIGEKLSLRIIKYRDVLGGFVTMDQLAEVYGLDSLVVNRLIENSFIVKGFEPLKININNASQKQLLAHPYLSKVATAIVSYRFQHGEFSSVEEIRNVVNMDDRIFQKIAPYLEVSDDL